IRDRNVTGVQTCALPISEGRLAPPGRDPDRGSVRSGSPERPSSPRVPLPRPGPDAGGRPRPRTGVGPRAGSVLLERRRPVGGDPPSPPAGRSGGGGAPSLRAPAGGGRGGLRVLLHRPGGPGEGADLPGSHGSDPGTDRRVR